MQRHDGHQAEIWLRPAPRGTAEVLLQLVDSGELTSTPRLGVRDATHEKGYIPGEQALLRVLNSEGQEVRSRPIRIETIVPKRMVDLQPADLVGSQLYNSWQEVQHDLSRFERHTLAPEEMVSIITFSYL